jgi:hypothetical protein
MFVEHPMKRPFLLIGVCFVVTLSGRPGPAEASIKLTTSLPDLYRRVSMYLVVGKVAACDKEKRLVEVTVVDIVKGKSPGTTLRVQVPQPPDFVQQVAVNQPVVIFAGESPQGFAIVNLRDTWFVAQGIGNVSPPAWRVLHKHDTLEKNVPGNTSSLIKQLGELKTARPAK